MGLKISLTCIMIASSEKYLRNFFTNIKKLSVLIKEAMDQQIFDINLVCEMENGPVT